ncbi:MAG: carboxylesterase family protein [Pseudomonadota bacterium]
MTSFQRAIWIFGAAIVFAACSRAPSTPPTPEAAEQTRTLTAYGEVEGFVADNGAHVWRGVPFAASTAGDNRWRAPRPPQPWSGVRPAQEFGERCPQYTNAFSAAEGFEPGLIIGSEDCLFLDVYAKPSAAKSPVMVWIHGGGNVWGTSKHYDASALVMNENVVVVAVQYRLGPLGWFAHDALRESAETEEDKGANFGTLDLIAALKWVRENVENFGGDPENVTVFGESAGGQNVATLLASPLAAGLFQKAIIQSGLLDSVSIEEASGVVGDEENAAQTIVERLGVDTAEGLRALSVETFFMAYDGAETGAVDMPKIISDGVVLPETPLREAFRSRDTFNAVPTISGVNRDEMKLFYLLDPRYVRTFFGTLITPRDQDLYDAASEYASRIWRVRSVDDLGAKLKEADHGDYYAYRFDWDEGGRFLIMDLGSLLGAGHAVEIPFIFNRFQLLGAADRILFHKKTSESRERLSRNMGRYWASFARTGTPEFTGAPSPWPAYNSAAGGVRLLRFDSDSDGGISVLEGVDSIALIAQDLAADSRLETDAERCLIAAALIEWVESAGEAVAGKLSCPAVTAASAG